MAHAQVVDEPADRLLVSVQDAAYLLNVSYSHVKRLIASGELASIKTGSRRLVPHAALIDFLAARAAAS